MWVIQTSELGSNDVNNMLTKNGIKLTIDKFPALYNFIQNWQKNNGLYISNPQILNCILKGPDPVNKNW
jgi:hypothetical protein